MACQKERAIERLGAQLIAELTRIRLRQAVIVLLNRH
jgi:hypothetical protein